MAAATGWGSGSTPRDAVVTGKIIRYGKDGWEALSFTLKARTCQEFRIDVQAPTGVRSTVVNSGRAIVTGPDGSRFLPSQSVLSMNPIVLPHLCVLNTLQKTDSGAIYAGTETLSDQLSHRIEISPDPVANDSLAAATRHGIVLTIWVSKSTALPIQIGSTLVATNNPAAGLTMVHALSDYRIVNGFALPFHQETSAGAALLYATQLDSVAFNVGLTDSEFVVPLPQSEE